MLIRATVVLQAASSIPRDAAVNVFHFLSTATDIEDIGPDILGELEGFYAVPVVDDLGETITDSALYNYLSPTISRATDSIRVLFAEVIDPDNVSSAIEASFSIGDPLSEEPLPNEVAACLTTYATPLLTVPIRRRRGRIYFGPLNQAAIGVRDVAGVDYPSLTTEFRDHAARAMKRLSRANERIFADWVVYSRRNDEAYSINNGWVDNELDTIRSRGLDASLRTDWSNPGGGPTTIP